MGTTSLNIVFAGTPDFAATHLAALIDSPHRLIAVYTQPDRPAGRGKRLQASPVKALALREGLSVHQPHSLKDPAEQERLAVLAPDVLVVVAYGLILPPAILAAPRRGCINVHASLLPRWRGAAPIQRAIEAGDARTGTTIMQMDAGLDTGDMLAQAECPIGPETTAASLHDALADLGAPLLIDVLGDLEAFQRDARKQPDAGVTYAEKIKKSEALLDWSRSAEALDRQIRAFNPSPVCYTELHGERLRVWACTAVSEAASGHDPGTVIAASEAGLLVQCGDGQLAITRLQLPGGRPLEVAQVLHSKRESLAPGVRFGPVSEGG